MFETREDQSETVMPFVLCRSRGGPYDDDAFTSGFRLGDLGATLAHAGASAVSDAIRPRERHQADLIAMARGYTMTVEPGSDTEWLYVTFNRAREA